MYFDAKPVIDYHYFKEMRFQPLKKFTPEHVTMNAKGFKVPVLLEEIKGGEESFVQYRFSIEKNILREIILLQENVAYFEMVTPLKEGEEREFLDYILPLFGVVHYGFLPGAHQSSGLTMRILSTFFDKHEKVIHRYGEILENENETKGLSVYTGDGGFYCLSYSFSKNVKIAGEKDTKEFFTLKHKWSHVIDEVEKTIQKNRMKLVFWQN